MRRIGLEFDVDSHTHFREEVPAGMAPEDVPVYFAEQKSAKFHREIKDSEVLVSADTVVICDGELMGKPHHRSDAKEMLEKLSGKTHKVVSAICVRTAHKTRTYSDTALVTFKELSRKEIDFYVESCRPTDKAGGYGIQEWIGLIGITRIEGSFYTIMGLPTHLLYQALNEV